jgi:hypothetical protein
MAACNVAVRTQLTLFDYLYKSSSPRGSFHTNGIAN